MIPPGLTCAACYLAFGGQLARRTVIGYVHARTCTSADVLTGGAWVVRGGTARWITTTTQEQTA